MSESDVLSSITPLPAATLAAAGIRLARSTELYADRHAPGDAGLPLLVIDNALGRAVIAPQGAHILAFQPAGTPEMLWVSPRCVFAAGQPMRGGIPLCLPWFGPGPDGKSMHGFARTLPWQLAAVEKLADGASRLVFALTGEAGVSALWPHAFAFRLEVVVGRRLELQLTATNRSESAAPFAFAYHTYFAVPDVAAARVDGLDRLTYIDKTDSFARKTQTGPVTISAQTDRIYLDVPQVQTIAAGDRRIAIESTSRCAVVWNAWDNDKNIVDLGAGNHVGYLCVERGDAADYAVTLTPGGQYRLAMSLAY